MAGIPWTWQEEAWLKQHYADTPLNTLKKTLGFSARRIHFKAYELGLKKSPEFLKQNGKNPNFVKAGAKTRFPKGHKPWNTGISIDTGGRSHATHFQKGSMPKNYKPVGTILPTTDGYLRIKVADPNVWEFLHLKLWIEAHGPVPKGWLVVFKDGDHAHCVLDNLEMIDRSELLRRNQNKLWKHYPEELKQSIRLVHALKTSSLHEK